MSRKKKDAEKLDILNKILENKELLIEGNFSGQKITNQEKNKKWQEILEYGQGQGYSWLMGQDIKYLRDTFWQNCKQTTTRKRDAKRPTGAGGGKEKCYTERKSARDSGKGNFSWKPNQFIEKLVVDCLNHSPYCPADSCLGWPIGITN